MAALIMGAAMASDFKTVHPVSELSFHPVVGDVDYSQIATPVPAKIAKDARLAFSTNSSIEEMNYPDLTAQEATCWYYGDLLGDGTAFYLLILADQCGISNGGAPITEGHMMRLFVNGPDVADAANPELPAGEYIASDSYGIGTIDKENSDFLDVFLYDIDYDGEKDLVGYIYTLTDGFVEATANGETYGINADCDIELNDDEGMILANGYATMSYEGSIDNKIYGPSAYPALSDDYEMTIMGVSGRYTTGNFSLAFYSVALDEDGFIIGGGDLMNVELLTENNEPADYTTLAGVYTCSDFYGGVYPAGTFVGGAWYPVMGSYYAAVGTALSVYDDNCDVEYVGLSKGGTITIADKGNGIFSFDFDLITAEDHKLTGHWEGLLADYVEDWTYSAIEELAESCTKDAAMPRYSLNGSHLTDGMQHGIAIEMHNGKYTKVMR